MRSGALALVKHALQAVAERGAPDVILANDMLDLPSWLGMLSRRGDGASLLRCPVATYFHENQWNYPQSPRAPSRLSLRLHQLVDGPFIVRVLVQLPVPLGVLYSSKRSVHRADARYAR